MWKSQEGINFLLSYPFYFEILDFMFFKYASLKTSVREFMEYPKYTIVA